MSVLDGRQKFRRRTTDWCGTYTFDTFDFISYSKEIMTMLPPDQLDIHQAKLLNTHDVRDWPITAAITRLEFRSTGVHVEHTKNMGAGAWPNFRPPKWEGDLQYTLWIFLKINAQWYGSGCIQFWQACEENGGPPEEFAKNWYYAADRWSPMTGYQPRPGEVVGFMVSAGDARNAGMQSVQERSGIVLMPFPQAGAVFQAQAWVPPAPVPLPEPSPEPTPIPAPPEILVSILDRLDAIDQQLQRGFTNRYAGAITPVPKPKP